MFPDILALRHLNPIKRADLTNPAAEDAYYRAHAGLPPLDQILHAVSNRIRVACLRVAHPVAGLRRFLASD
jgi:hypothetical protein